MDRGKLLEDARSIWLKLMGQKEMLSEQYQCTTKDGKSLIVMGQDLAVGLEIYEVDADGNQTPLADGEYQLEDGRGIVVSAGKIGEISLPSAEEVEAPEAAPAMEEMNTETTNTNVDFTSLKSELDSLKEEFVALKAKMDEMLQMSNDTMSEAVKMQEQIAKISAEPAGKITIPVTLKESTQTSGYTYDKDRILALKKQLFNK